MTKDQFILYDSESSRIFLFRVLVSYSHSIYKSLSIKTIINKIDVGTYFFNLNLLHLILRKSLNRERIYFLNSVMFCTGSLRWDFTNISLNQEICLETTVGTLSSLLLSCIRYVFVVLNTLYRNKNITYRWTLFWTRFQFQFSVKT